MILPSELDGRLKAELDRRRAREASARRVAASTDRSVVFVDDDGCEVTVTPAGHVFYNVGDWW